MKRYSSPPQPHLKKKYQKYSKIDPSAPSELDKANYRARHAVVDENDVDNIPNSNYDLSVFAYERDHDYCRKSDIILYPKYHNQSPKRNNKNDRNYCCSECVQETEYLHLQQRCEKTKHQNSKIVAKRNLAPGQIICKEYPIMRIHEIRKYYEKAQAQPSNKIKLPCVGCTASWTTIKCSKCRLPLCSRSCESSLCHKWGECSAIQKYNIEINVDMKSTPLIVMCYLMDIYITRVLMSKITKRDQLHRIIMKMVEHTQVKKALRSDNFLRVSNDLQKLGKLCYAIENDIELINKIACVITTIPCNPSKYPLSMDVLFPTFSWMTHSCNPNTEFWIQGEEDEFEIRVVSIMDIEANEPITVDIWSLNLLGTEQRAEFLKNKFIDCECRMCKDPEECGSKKSGLLCLQCKKEFYYPIDTNNLFSTAWCCKGCHHKITRNVVELLMIKVKKILGNTLTSSPRTLDMKTLSNTRRYLLRLLHPNHSVLLQLYKKVFDYYVRQFWRKRHVDPAIMNIIQRCIKYLEPMDSAKSNYLIDHACYKFFLVISGYCLEKTKTELTSSKDEFSKWPNFIQVPSLMKNHINLLQSTIKLLDLLDIPLYHDYLDSSKAWQNVLKATLPLLQMEATDKRCQTG